MGAGSSAAEEALRSRARAEELRQQAQRLEERAAAFSAGYVGEVAVAEQLQRLSHLGYRRFDDIRWPGRVRANIDICLIGPAGLFVIDAKNWTGTVRAGNGVLKQNGYRREKEIEGAAEATRCVVAAMALPPIGHAVICLAGSASVPQPTEVAGVTVVSLDHIVDWIARQPAVVSAAAVAVMADRLACLLRPATQPARQTYQRRTAARSLPRQPTQFRPAASRPPRANRPPQPARPTRARQALLSLAALAGTFTALEIYVHILSQTIAHK